MQALELAKHLFQNKQVRIYGTPDRPLFVASDIGAIFDIKNIHASISTLENYEKDTVMATDSRSHKRAMIALTEAGLYALTFTSRKPIAKEFKKWVVLNVLPTIRRTGSYDVQTTIDKQSDEHAIEVAALKAANEKLAAEKQSEKDNAMLRVLALQSERDAAITQHLALQAEKDAALSYKPAPRAENAKLADTCAPNIEYHPYDLNDFVDHSCVYIFHIANNDYKFGISDNIADRTAAHIRNFKKYNCDVRLIKLWKCRTSVIMRDCELKIKTFGRQNAILVDKYDQREILTTNNIAPIVDKIDGYVNNANDCDSTSMRIRELELNNEQLRMHIELARIQLDIQTKTASAAAPIVVANAGAHSPAPVLSTSPAAAPIVVADAGAHSPVPLAPSPVPAHVVVADSKRCCDCNKEFATAATLAKHKRRTTPCISVGSPAVKGKVNKCSYCAHVYVRHGDLVRHRKLCKLKHTIVHKQN